MSPQSTVSAGIPRLSIVFAVPDFEPAVGGTTRQTGLQARELAARGHRVAVVAHRTDGRWAKREARDGLTVYRIGRAGRGRLSEKLALGMLWLWLARRRGRIDILQTVMWANGALAATAAGLREHTAVLWAIDGEVADATDLGRPGLGPLSRLLRRARHKALTSCEHVVLTPKMLEELSAHGLSGRVIPVPVDGKNFRPPNEEERSEARRQLEIEPTELVVLTLGHLQARKRIDRLIDAFARIEQPARLVIVGGSRQASDDVEGELRRQVADLGLEDRVIFTGAVQQPRPFLWAADVFVLTSEREGMPNSILEAMSVGLPCVVPESAGGDALLDETTGFVLPTAEPGDLAAALGIVMADREQAASRAMAARTRADEFDVGRVCDEYERLYYEMSHVTGAAGEPTPGGERVT